MWASASTKAASGPLPVPLISVSTPSILTIASIRSAPPSTSEAITRWRIRSSGRTGARYSCANASHISFGETSPPSPPAPSAIFWITWLNSICSRRGSARPWSAFMM